MLKRITPTYTPCSLTRKRRRILGMVLAGINIASVAANMPRHLRAPFVNNMNVMLRAGWITPTHELSELGQRLVEQYLITPVHIKQG